jgi:DNA helicase-2/ATP-dependent DNA helicase PcrA
VTEISEGRRSEIAGRVAPHEKTNRREPVQFEPMKEHAVQKRQSAPNAEQEEAIRHRKGPMLVLAGPGTGKTTIIANRCARLIQGGVRAEQMLVVTFTRAAAAEMRGRIHQTVGSKAAGISIGTFHGIFYGMLRSVYRLGSGTVLSGTERRTLIWNLLRTCYRDAEKEAELSEQVGREISLVKAGQIDPSHYYSTSLPDEIFRRVLSGYQSALRDNKRIDFDDLILYCHRMLQTRPKVRAYWQRKFEYILIDEFQDISPLQYEVIRTLAEPQNNLFIVGDDDQSIYRFRGANPQLMLNFGKDYPDARRVTLRINYRSTPEIVAFSSGIIAENKHRFEKHLRANREKGAPVCLRVFEGLYEEADFLSRSIRARISSGCDPDQIAVLVRTNAGMRHIIERFLSDRVEFRAQETIPCVYDHWAAKDVLAYLELAAGSRRRKDFLRICNRPLRYISRNDLEQNEIAFDDLYSRYCGKEWMQKRIARLENDIVTLSHLAPAGAIGYIRRAIGYEEFLAEYADEHGLEEESLTAVLDELEESARGCRTYFEWKQKIEAYRESIKEQGSRAQEHGVTIATMHASKGCEFDIVYLVDLNDTILPHRKAVLAADVEEERRMFYVGLTRARYELNLSAVRRRYGKTLELTPFLEKAVRRGALKRGAKKS